MSLTALQKRRNTRSRHRRHKKSTSTTQSVKKSQPKSKSARTSKTPSHHSSRSSPKHKAATRLQKIVRGRQTRRSVLGSPKTCAICLEDVNNLNKNTAQCVGKHPFHQKCLDEWLQRDKKQSCPACRGPIKLTEEQQTKLLLNRFSNEELNAMETMFSYFVDSVLVFYEHDVKKIPALEKRIIPELAESLKIVDEIIKLKNMSMTEIKNMLKKNKIGLMQLQLMLNLQYDKLIDSIGLVKQYKKARVDIYRTAQMGIDYGPDNIVRPPRTERGTAMTRRVRSH
mgnify:CR=1 FL=1